MNDESNKLVKRLFSFCLDGKQKSDIKNGKPNDGISSIQFNVSTENICDKS